MKKKFAGCKFLVFVLSAFLAWGVGATCFADNATEVVIQVSYPDGDGWAEFYYGTAADIDLSVVTEKANYVNVHITLLDANGDPATAGPAGEAIGGVVATVGTELGSITGNEDEFLADSDELTFDITDVGPAARAHVKYACKTNCVPGTDTIDVAVGSLTADVDVDVRAPKAVDLVVRTPVTGSSAMTLFDAMPSQKKNLSVPILAGNDVYFEVLAREGAGSRFTTAPELDGKQVTVSAYGDYSANNIINGKLEDEVIETETVVFQDGKATGNITINKAGTLDGDGTAQLKVLLTAQVEDGVETPQNDDDPATTDPQLDWVGVRSGSGSQLIIGKDPTAGNTGNLIEEVDTWFVIDDNTSGPTTNAMAVFLADSFGNPVTGTTVIVSASLSGPLVDEPMTLFDSSGAIPETAAESTAWKINTARSDPALDGIATLPDTTPGSADNQQDLTGCGTTCRGEPLEALLTLSALGLDPDSATVWLVRTDKTNGETVSGDSYSSALIDINLDTDTPGTVTAGSTVVTLYITDATGTAGNPSTSEIVELGDKLVINATECTSGDEMVISRSTSSFSSATDDGLEVTAPAPDSSTKHIEIPIKVWGECDQGTVLSICFDIDDTSKGIEDIDHAVDRGPSNCIPNTEDSCKITLPTGVIAKDKDLDADPLVITSDFRLGDNTLLTASGVDTADAYGNVVNDTPSYGANVTNNVGLAITADMHTTINFAEDDVGETAEITVTVSGVCSRDIEIINITDAVATGALRCTLEGPALPPPGGEAIIQVDASTTFSSPATRSVLVSVEDNSVTAELRNLTGDSEGTTSAGDLVADGMRRLVVSAEAEGTVTIQVGDASGAAALLDTGTCTVTFAIDDEDPVATISPADGSTVTDTATAEIEITITDNVGVSLGLTSYTIDKDNADYLASLDCVNAGDGSTSATITCSETGGGLSEGSYDVSVTPGDLAGRTGTTETSAFTVSSAAGCTNTVTITPATATICVTGTQTFTAATACNGTSVTETYTWSVAGTAGSIDASGVYTAGSAAGTDTVTVTGDTTGMSDTAAVTVTAGEVTISPSTAALESGETQQFTASTSCSVTETYTYTISTNTSGGTIVAGLYTAGTTAGTDTVTATGDTTADTDDATVTVTTTTTGGGTITVIPSTVVRMNWIIWPAVMTITGIDTNFGFLASQVNYSSTSVLPMPALVLSATSILEVIFIMPPWLAGGTTTETVTVTVTTGTETATGGTFGIEMWGLPIPSP